MISVYDERKEERENAVVVVFVSDAFCGRSSNWLGNGTWTGRPRMPMKHYQMSNTVCNGLWQRSLYEGDLLLTL